MDDEEDAELANVPGEGDQNVTLVKSRDNQSFFLEAPDLKTSKQYSL